MSSNTSQLFEQVNKEILGEDNLFSVTILDSHGNVTEHLEQVKIDNPFAFDTSMLSPNTIPFDLPRFIEVANDVIVDAQGREGIETDYYVAVTAEFPDKEFGRIAGLSNEVITWKVIKREPAKMSVKGDSRPQRKARFTRDLRLSAQPNKVITVETRPIDHIIEFSCWSTSAQQANDRALWLERLFVTHSWAFEIQGADRFFWKERGIDTYATVGNIKLYQRPVRFHVRTLEHQISAAPMIQHMTFNISSPKS
jgi:hypothetical protein